MVRSSRFFCKFNVSLNRTPLAFGANAFVSVCLCIFTVMDISAVQKRIAACCRENGTPFMVVTQMLASMEHSRVPTRAEMSDVFNAVLDGATSVMVTGETAAGEYPADVIRYLALAAHAAEAFLKENGK